MRVSFRLSAFYFAFFVGAGLMVAYFPPYLAGRGHHLVLLAAQLLHAATFGSFHAGAVAARWALAFTLSAAAALTDLFFAYSVKRTGL